MLEQKLDALTAAIEALTAALTAKSVSAPAPAPATPPAPETKVEETKAPETKIEAPPAPPTQTGPTEQDVKDLTLARSREGHKDAIRDWLANAGVKKISDLKGAQTTEFYDWLKTLGSN
jgi:hypothetical protein